MKLYNDDCLNVFDKLDAKSIDCIICDVPYGITNNEWDKIIDFKQMWDGIYRVVKDDAAICLFSQMPFGAKLISSNIKNYKYNWVFRKSRPANFLQAKRMPLRNHEEINIFGSTKAIRYYPQFTYAEPYTRTVTVAEPYSNKITVFSENYGFSKRKNKTENKDGKRYPTSLIKNGYAYKRPQNNTHPTQKPLDLLEYLIKTYTLEGETVLDFCMGTGSTGQACINTNREFVGIELEKKYFDIANDALNKKEMNNAIKKG